MPIAILAGARVIVRFAVGTRVSSVASTDIRRARHRARAVTAARLIRTRVCHGASRCRPTGTRGGSSRQRTARGSVRGAAGSWRTARVQRVRGTAR